MMVLGHFFRGVASYKRILRLIPLLLVFNLIWIWIAIPLLSVIASPFVAVFRGEASPAAIGALGQTLIHYISSSLFSGISSCDYAVAAAAPGWAVLIVADVTFFFSAIGLRKRGNAILDAQPRAERTSLHGNAKLLRTDAEIRAEDDIVFTRHRDVESDVCGIYLGVNSRGDIYSYDSDEHCLLLAPTRSGKTRKELVEIIATLGYAGECMTIFDPKGELFGYCNEFLEQHGFAINRIDFANPNHGNLWNPLARAMGFYRQIACMPKIDLSTISRLQEIRQASRVAKVDMEQLKARVFKTQKSGEEAVDEQRAYEKAKNAYLHASVVAVCAEMGRQCDREEAERLVGLRLGMERARRDRMTSDDAEDRYRQCSVRYWAAIYDYSVSEEDLVFEATRVVDGTWRPANLFEQVENARKSVMQSSGDEREDALAHLYRKKELLDRLLRASEIEVDKLVETIHPRDRTRENGTAAFYADGADNVMKLCFHTVLASMTCPDECKTPATVARVMRDYMKPAGVDSKGGDERRAFALYEIVDKFDPAHPARKYMGVLGTSSKYIAEFVNEAQGIMERFLGVSANQMMKGTDYSMEDLVCSEKPTATFIIIPNGATEALKRLCLLYIDQLYTVLQELARVRGGRIPRRMNMILEEMGQLPPIKDLEQRLAISGGTGFRWVLVLQDFAQIDALYGRDARATIVNNCRYNVLVEIGDPNTAKYFSEMAGTYTVEKTSSSSSRSTSPFSFAGGSVSDSTQLVERKRMSEGEILQWKSAYGSLLWRRGHPLTVMPTPDLSRTFFNEALGCGDEEYNTMKFADALARRVHDDQSFIEDWGPEINSFEKLSLLASHAVGAFDTDRMREKHVGELVADARVRTDNRERVEKAAKCKAEAKAKAKAKAKDKSAGGKATAQAWKKGEGNDRFGIA